MNPVDQTFARLKNEGRKAFVPFITAGDPDLATTARVIAEAARRGASLIEIGFPYSDPVADGKEIQASYTRALNAGATLDRVFDTVRGVALTPNLSPGGRGEPVPLVAMVSYSIVHRRGLASFVADAQAAGFSGAIVPDMPVDEADELAKIAAQHDFKLILLVTPATPPERAARIAKVSTGFLYCVSVIGITGERSELPAGLLDQMHWLRTQTSLPLCVGFGISKPEHVRRLRDAVDGVIVGSALVRKLAGDRPIDQRVRDFGDLVQELSAALTD
ncbi:MAG TPA: tryptophan synthase subunit alpha [Gemmataceae bacterium]|nr:tryptophan synthase subunit alpha [Gemmataceae bacterium]